MIAQFITSRKLIAILARWTLICTVSAGPSFFWGCVLHHQIQHIMGMIVGIVLFILGYTMVECSAAYRRVIRWPHVRRTIWIGYGTRLVMSIIFPIALMVDMWTGIIAVGLIELPLSQGGSERSFFLVLLTTLIQGTLLNVVLFVYMGLVWIVVCSVAVISKRPGTESLPARAEQDEFEKQAEL